jgi:hypothetical protein
VKPSVVSHDELSRRKYPSKPSTQSMSIDSAKNRSSVSGEFVAVWPESGVRTGFEMSVLVNRWESR